MDTSSNANQNRERESWRRPSTGRGYRWTCPICGFSRVSSAIGEDEAYHYKRARSAVLSHVSASADADHGSKNRYPTGFELEAVEPHIEPVGE